MMKQFKGLMFSLICASSLNSWAACGPSSANKKACSLTFEWVNQYGQNMGFHPSGPAFECPSTRSACEVACHAQHALARAQRAADNITAKSESVQCVWGEQNIFAMGSSSGQTVGASNNNNQGIGEECHQNGQGHTVCRPLSLNPVIQNPVGPQCQTNNRGDVICNGVPPSNEIAKPQAPVPADSPLKKRAQKLRGQDIFQTLAKMKANVKKNTKLSQQEKAALLSRIEEIADITRTQANDKEMLTEGERGHLFARIHAVNAQIANKSGGDGTGSWIKNFEARIAANLKNGTLTEKEAQQIRKKINELEIMRSIASVDEVSEKEEELIRASMDTINEMIILNNHNQKSLDEMIKDKKSRIQQLASSGKITQKHKNEFLKRLNAEASRLAALRKTAGKKGISRDDRIDLIVSINRVVEDAHAVAGDRIQTANNR